MDVILIDSIEDFRDALLEKKPQVGDMVSSAKVLLLIKEDENLTALVKRITKEGNLRRTAVMLAIEEFLKF